MPPLRTIHHMLWVTYALAATVHIGALLAEGEVVQRVTQTVFAPLLLAAVLTSASRLGRTGVLMVVGLCFAGLGDTLSQVAPSAVQQISAVCFLAALVCYANALFPLWRRRRDSLRIALAIPYGGVVIGLFVACADGAGPLLPLVAAYAVVLAIMAFLSAGGNGMTWTGGTMFLLSSSLLAMDWFLPGAAMGFSNVLVMITYTIGHALLVAGIVQALPQRRRSPQCSGAALVIVEN